MTPRLRASRALQKRRQLRDWESQLTYTSAMVNVDQTLRMMTELMTRRVDRETYDAELHRKKLTYLQVYLQESHRDTRELVVSEARSLRWVVYPVLAIVIIHAALIPLVRLL